MTGRIFVITGASGVLGSAVAKAAAERGARVALIDFADHAEETGSPIPKEPILFNKAPNCIVGPNDDVIIPKGSEKTDWEVELAIVIGDAIAQWPGHDSRAVG